MKKKINLNLNVEDLRPALAAIMSVVVQRFGNKYQLHFTKLAESVSGESSVNILKHLETLLDEIDALQEDLQNLVPLIKVLRDPQMEVKKKNPSQE